MLQGIAFDYDGTIGQTFERQFNWFLHWADVNKKPFDFANVREFLPFYNRFCAMPGGVQNVYDELGLPCNMKDRSHPVWGAYIRYKEEHDVPFYPGIRKAIEDVWQLGHLSTDSKRNRRLRLAINTTNTWESIYGDLAREGVLPCFDSFVTYETLADYQGANDPHSITKPSKISLALILGLIDSDGEFTMHIGDTLNDLASSHKVMRLNPQKPETLITVGAAWGYEGRDVLERGIILPGTSQETSQQQSGQVQQIHFNYIIDKPEELIEIVREVIGVKEI